VPILKELIVIPGMEGLSTRAGEMTLSAVFLAGIATSLGLCAAIRLPLAVVYVTGAGRSRGHALVLSVLFVLGLMAGTVLLGTNAVLMGDGRQQVFQVDKHLFWGLGLGLVAAGLLVSGLINPQLLPRWLRGIGELLTRVGWLGALLAGGALGLLQTPVCPSCSAALQTLAETARLGGASSDGLLLLTGFAAGQSAVVLCVAVLVSVMRRDVLMWLRAAMCSVEPRMQLLAGNLLMVLGLYFVIVG
jgi:cytochrome c biogenesis protein CcdA